MLGFRHRSPRHAPPDEKPCASFICPHLAIALWPAGPAAQGPQSPAGPAAGSAFGAAADPAASSTEAGARRVLTLADYAGWKRITSAAISDDGKWVDVHLHAERRERDAVRQTAGRRQALHAADRSAPARAVRVVPRQVRPVDAAVRAVAARCSSPITAAGWRYFVNPPARAGHAERQAAARQHGVARRQRRPRRAGATGAGGQSPGNAPGTGAATAAPTEARRFELLDLESGTRDAVPNASGFQFAKGSAWLAIKMNGTPNDTTHRGTDLLLRRLATGATQNSVTSSGTTSTMPGTWLGLHWSDATNAIGNGVYVSDARDGRNAHARRRRQWTTTVWCGAPNRPRACRYCAATSRRAKTMKDNALLAWSRPSAPPTRSEDRMGFPRRTPAFPKGFLYLSQYTAPRWTKDGTGSFVGIKAQIRTRVQSPSEEQANLDIFHWKDVELQSEQIVRVAQARTRARSCSLDLASQFKAFVRLADDTIPDRHSDS